MVSNGLGFIKSNIVLVHLFGMDDYAQYPSLARPFQSPLAALLKKQFAPNLFPGQAVSSEDDEDDTQGDIDNTNEASLDSDSLQSEEINQEGDEITDRDSRDNIRLEENTESDTEIAVEEETGDAALGDGTDSIDSSINQEDNDKRNRLREKLAKATEDMLKNIENEFLDGR